MRYLVGLIGMVLFLGACAKKEATPKETAQTQEAQEMKMAAEQVLYYTCPMEQHKHVHSNEPGNCPECGMTLVAVTEATAGNQDFYGCPMEAHSHVRSAEPGNCPECGMVLKPMRLEKEGT